MKTVLLALLFVTSTSFAGDVVAVGAKLREGNVMIESSNSGISCQLQAYSEAPTCPKIEGLNRSFNAALSTGSYINNEVYCDNGTAFTVYTTKYLNEVAEQARVLAIGSQPDEVVWTMIKNYEANVLKFQAEVKQIKAQAKLDEVYINDCVNGDGPSNGSILEQICH